MTPTAPTDPLTGLSAARLGLYVHFPYCLSKCPYCDFASTVAKEIPEERYAKAILSELELRLEGFPQLAGRSLGSVFFGGGTPSLWNAAWVERVLGGITSHLPLTDGAEVTLEANPGAADASRFESFRAAGINRLSIGVQSFEARTLAALGRAHDGSAAENAFRAARKAKFANVSMDFIYGVHGQQLDRKSTRLNSSDMSISYAVFCLKKKKKTKKKKKKNKNKKKKQTQKQNKNTN